MRLGFVTSSILAVLVLAGCGGGGTTIPAGTTSTANSVDRAPEGTTVAFERGELWVAYQTRADAFPTATAAGSVTPSVTLGPARWSSTSTNSPGIVDIAVAPDGTTWILENRDFALGGAGWRLFAFAPNATRPENTYGSETDTPLGLGLAGDSVMVWLARTNGSQAIVSYPYASNFPPALHTLTSATRLVSFAEGNDGRLYVARSNRVDVYRPDDTGCCPLRSIAVTLPAGTGNHGFSVGPDESIYALDAPKSYTAPQVAYVNVYSPSTGALTRRIGPIPSAFDPLAPSPPIAVDAENRVYVATNGHIYRFGPHAHGAATPQRVWTDASTNAQPVALAVGPAIRPSR